MADRRRTRRAGVKLRKGLRVEPAEHDEQDVESLAFLLARPIRGEGTLAPLTEIPPRVFRRLERSRCPPLPEHVPPGWLAELIRGDWDARTLLLALRKRLKERDPETTFEIALSILGTLGAASEDGRTVRELLTVEQLSKLRKAREKNDAR